jgi:hypothetical protein
MTSGLEIVGIILAVEYQLNVTVELIIRMNTYEDYYMSLLHE